MTAYTYTAAEILEHRESLFDVEVLLNQAIKDELYEMESVETQIVVRALVNESQARLRKAFRWLEKMNDQADKAEEAKQ